MTIAFFLTQFTVAFISIFLRGVQTQNVVSGDYKGAFLTSFGMGGANVVFIGLIAADPWASFIPASLGAALGITSSMYYKRNGIPLFNKQKNN